MAFNVRDILTTGGRAIGDVLGFGDRVISGLVDLQRRNVEVNRPKVNVEAQNTPRPPSTPTPTPFASPTSEQEVVDLFKSKRISQEQANRMLNQGNLTPIPQVQKYTRPLNVSNAQYRTYTSAAGNRYEIPKIDQYDNANIEELVKKYFPKSQWANAMRVIQGESGGRWYQIGDDYIIPGDISEQTGTPIPSYGIFQVRAFPGRPSPEKLLDPEINIKYAADLWKRSGWQPWTVGRELGL